MSVDSPQLGPFSVGERIGEGGMGAVYRGEHCETGLLVAIKVIRRAADDGGRRRFHREVQAHAGLQHPGVVYLFEYGDIDDEAARSSNGELRAGDPFVAMELADRGTVRDHVPLAGWETVCRMLVQILDALAYSHARGVIHRDLKPENFLVFDSDDNEVGWRIKLADFGIAHAFGREREADTEDLESAAGTPHYMAPEQLRGSWRDYGPWTDLYALGCIAWELVCGRPPFTGDSAFAIAMSHETDERPPVDPQFPIPDELESWIHRAMATDPDRRFRRAADAAWALPRATLARETDDPTRSSLSEMKTTDDPMAPTQTAALASTVVLDEGNETALDETLSPGAGESAETEAPVDVDEPTASGVETDPEHLFDMAHPPVPEDWRTPEAESLPAPLVGAGLGLFGLREAPFVDRDTERDWIWEALQRVEQTGDPQVVFVTGESGSGKSRLVERMAVRAHEVGAARVMRAVHGRGGGSTDEGVSGMVRRLVRGQKLGRKALYERLLETLPVLDDDRPGPEMEARAICELIHPTDEDEDAVEGPPFRFASRDHKCAVIARLLRRYGDERPAFVWLDDAQWSELAMDLVEYLTQSPFVQPPALVVVTARTEALNENDRFRERVESLVDGDACSSIRLDPLNPEDHRRFVGRMLPLAADLADRIAERTEGNPLFATQLLGHLVENQQLEVGPEGFEVATGVELEVPDEIHELWMRRLSRVVAGFDDERPGSVWEALERAAALGRQIEGAEWRALCDGISIEQPALVRDRLVERGLADRTDGGWSFAHDLLVESLHRRARERGEWAAHNCRCAELLEEVYPHLPTHTAARRADHWIEGDQPEKALAPLLKQRQRLGELGDPQRARETLERRETLLDQLGISEDAPTSIENDIELARTDVYLGASPEEVWGRLENARTRAERIGDDRLVALAATVLSEVHRRRGDLTAAREAGRSATRGARDCGDDRNLLRALHAWGWADFKNGNLDSAEARMSELRRRADECNKHYEHLYARRNLAAIWNGRGRDEQAAELLEETLEEAYNAGHRQLAGQCHNDLGENARFRGEADEARKHYRRYARISNEMAYPRSTAFSHANLAQVELMAGRFEASRKELEESTSRFEELSQKAGHVHLLRLIELTLAAGTGAWSVFDERSAHYEGGWPEQARLIKDYPWLLEMAGDYAAESGERERAERVWQLSRDLWDALDYHDATERLDRKLADAS